MTKFLESETLSSAECLDITPAMAKLWLGRNIGNRRMSASFVDQYARAMSDGEWRETHQAIYLDAHGRVIDGQHRLAAICKSGVTVRCLVIRSKHGKQPIGEPIDVGRKRGADYICGISSTESATANFMATVAVGRAPALHETSRFWGWISPEHNQLSKTVLKGFSISPVRAAVILRMKNNKPKADWVAEQYARCLSFSTECEGISPIVRSLFNQLVLTPRGLAGNMCAALAYRAFDYPNRDITKLQYKNEDILISAFKEDMAQAWADHL